MTEPKYHLVLDHAGQEKTYGHATLQDAQAQFETFKRDPQTFSATVYKAHARNGWRMVRDASGQLLTFER